MKNPIFLAHRGGWKPGRRENTVQAIERAAKSGRFAYIEIDVQRTRSDDEGVQTPVVIHDATLDRLYKQYKVPLSKQSAKKMPVNALSAQVIRNQEVEVPTLAEAMRAAQGHPLNIEIKSAEAVDSTMLVISDMINKYPQWSAEKIVISSFDWSILYDCKQKNPDIGIAMLYTFKNLPRNFGRTYNELGARWISFSKYLAFPLIIIANALDIPNKFVYTVNSSFETKLLSLLGATGVYTDVVTLPDNFS